MPSFVPPLPPTRRHGSIRHRQTQVVEQGREDMRACSQSYVLLPRLSDVVCSCSPSLMQGFHLLLQCGPRPEQPNFRRTLGYTESSANRCKRALFCIKHRQQSTIFRRDLRHCLNNLLLFPHIIPVLLRSRQELFVRQISTLTCRLPPVIDQTVVCDRHDPREKRAASVI